MQCSTRFNSGVVKNVEIVVSEDIWLCVSVSYGGIVGYLSWCLNIGMWSELAAWESTEMTLLVLVVWRKWPVISEPLVDGYAHHLLLRLVTWETCWIPGSSGCQECVFLLVANKVMTISFRCEFSCNYVTCRLDYPSTHCIELLLITTWKLQLRAERVCPLPKRYLPQGALWYQLISRWCLR